MSAPFFADFDKSAKDALSKDYLVEEKKRKDSQYALDITQSGPFDLKFTTKSSLDATAAWPWPLLGSLSVKWPHVSGFTLEKLEFSKINGDYVVTTETSLVDEGFPNTKFEFKGNSTDKADLAFKHTIGADVTFTGSLDILDFQKWNVSILKKNGPFTGGLQLEKIVDKKGTTTYEPTLGLAYGCSAASAFGRVKFSLPKDAPNTESSKSSFSQLLARFLYPIDKKLTVAGELDYQTAKGADVAVGVVYKCNPDTSVKAKLTKGGIIAAAVKQNLGSKMSATPAIEVPISDLAGYKFGISLTLG